MRLGAAVVRWYAAEKTTYVRSKPHVNIGTIGHVYRSWKDYCDINTELLSLNTWPILGWHSLKLTMILIMPLKRGPGESPSLPLTLSMRQKRHYGHMDCPGHADYIKNMITGAAQMEGAIMVVAATDGTMPQTKEHLLLANQVGVKTIVVYINKADAVNDSEMLELVELELRETLDTYGYDGQKTQIPTPMRDLDKPFLLPIEHVYSIAGHGIVVTGRIEQGKIRKGQDIGENAKIKTKVTGLEMFHKHLDHGEAGDQLGALLMGIKRDEVKRGMVVCEPGTVRTHTKVKAQVYILTQN